MAKWSDVCRLGKREPSPTFVFHDGNGTRASGLFCFLSFILSFFFEVYQNKWYPDEQNPEAFKFYLTLNSLKCLGLLIVSSFLRFLFPGLKLPHHTTLRSQQWWLKKRNYNHRSPEKAQGVSQHVGTPRKSKKQNTRLCRRDNHCSYIELAHLYLRIFLIAQKNPTWTKSKLSFI